MTRQVTRGLSLIAIAVALVIAPATAHAQVTIAGPGSGSFETTAVGGGGTGWGSCTVDRNTAAITCETAIYNIVNLTAAHLHLGGPGSSGPVAIPIPDLPTGISGAFGQTFTLSGADLIPRPAQGVRNFDELGLCVRVR